jgi:hypothetical protein
MLMVILGAGASFDSCPTYPPGGDTPHLDGLSGFDDYGRPPLAKDLFANRPLFRKILDSFPQCKTIVPRLRDPDVTSGQKSIEDVLQEVEMEAAAYPRGLQELAAVRCYIHGAVRECEIQWRSATRGITNHLSLLREIERAHRSSQPVILVTFNYDTLLEDALDHLGLGIKTMEDYTERNTLFRLFKLHGSVNWSQQVDINLSPNLNRNHVHSVLTHLIQTAIPEQYSEKFILNDPSMTAFVDGRPVFPAIAIPVARKNAFCCPEVLITQLNALLPQVTKVLVVGWRGAEEHFLQLLARYLRRDVFISIVAGNRGQAEAIRVALNRALLNNPPSSMPEPGGFTDFIRTRRAQGILGQSGW